MPLQYRYLSLYKLLEMEFKKKRQWIDEYEESLDNFKEEFKNLGIHMKPANYIHCLRDRCAHITTGKNTIGITQLSNKDMAEVNKFLPLMAKICVSVLDKKYPNAGFSLVDHQTFIQEMEKQKQTKKMKYSKVDNP